MTLLDKIWQLVIPNSLKIRININCMILNCFSWSQAVSRHFRPFTRHLWQIVIWPSFTKYDPQSYFTVLNHAITSIAWSILFYFISCSTKPFSTLEQISVFLKILIKVKWGQISSNQKNEKTMSDNYSKMPQVELQGRGRCHVTTICRQKFQFSTLKVLKLGKKTRFRN